MSKGRRGRPPKAQQFKPNSDNTEENQKIFENTHESGNIMSEVKLEDEIAQARKRREERRANRLPGILDGQKMGAELKSDLKETYELRWFNDEGDRLRQKIADGWSYAKKSEVTAFSTDDGEHISQVVGSKKEGGALRAYLLKIPKEFLEEDRQVKREVIDKKVEDVRRSAGGNNLNNGADGRSVAYIPDGTNSEFSV